MQIRDAVAAVALAVMAGLGGAAPAQGVTFYYDAYGGFIVGTDSPGGSGAFANDPDAASGGPFDVGANADPRMAASQFVDVTWGNASGAQGPYDGKSGLALSKVDDGVVTVNGPLVDFGRLTHFNRPIGLGTDLDFVELEWKLQLFTTASDAAANTNPVKSLALRYTLDNWRRPTIRPPIRPTRFPTTTVRGGRPSVRACAREARLPER